MVNDGAPALAGRSRLRADVVAHTGGRRILDSLVVARGVEERLLEHSRASLREVGNTASVSVLDVLRRACGSAPEGGDRRGIIIAFGPGFTMELLVAHA